MFTPSFETRPVFVDVIYVPLFGELNSVRRTQTKIDTLTFSGQWIYGKEITVGRKILSKVKETRYSKKKNESCSNR